MDNQLAQKFVSLLEENNRLLKKSLSKEIPGEYLTISQLSKMFGKEPITIRAWLRDGVVPKWCQRQLSAKITVVSRKDLNEVLEKRRLGTKEGVKPLSLVKGGGRH